MNLKSLLKSIGLISILCLIMSPAFAMSLSQAKSQGFVGEQPNGYLGVVKSTPDVEDLVKKVNQGRKKAYAQISAQRGTPISQVEAIAGKQAIEKTRPGNFIKQGGSWKQK